MTSSAGGFAPIPPVRARIGGRTVEVFDDGSSREGDPVVVLLTGAGDTARSWLPVQAMLASSVRVIAYERAGVGASDPRPDDGFEGFIAELDAVIAASVPTGRVLLVGHSFGALVARIYARRHPDRVAGLVMLDATPDLLPTDRVRRVGYRLYVQSIAAARVALPRAVFSRLVRHNLLPYYPGRAPFLRLLDPQARSQWHRAVRDLFAGRAVEEMRQVLPGASVAAAELGTAGDQPAPMGDLPVALLTSGTYGRGWISMHDAIARRYPQSTHELSGDRFHNVHMRHTERTVRTVRAVLAASQGRPTPDPAAQD